MKGRLIRQAIWEGAFAALMGLLAGCSTSYTPWPSEGGGGVAEQYPAEKASLARLKERYLLLLNRRAGERHPAQMLLAQAFLFRAFREQAGGLPADSSQSAAAASAIMDDVERQLRRRRG